MTPDVPEQDGDWPFELLGPELLEGPLPEVATVLPERGQAVLARWVGPRFAAVLCVRNWGPEDEGPDPYLDLDVELYRRAPRGWDSWGGGGTNWHSADPRLRAPDLRPGEVALCVSGNSSGDGWHGAYAIGWAGSAARWLEVADRHDTVRRPMESRLGYFVVAWSGDGPATIRVLDQGERELAAFQEPEQLS